MKKITQLFSILALSFLMVSSVSAQKVSLDEIIDTYLENVGGVENWKAIKNMKITGITAMQGMEFPVERIAAAPTMFRMNLNIMGKKMVQAYDGETAWMINPMQGDSKAQKMDEDMTKELSKQEFEDAFIDYKEKGHTVTLEGKEEVDGTETYKIKMVKKDGTENIYFFDMEDMVPIMMRSFGESGPMKGQAVDTYLSDYQEVDGLYMPFSMEQKMAGQTVMQMTTESVELNIELEEDLFKMPAAAEAAPAEKK